MACTETLQISERVFCKNDVEKCSRGIWESRTLYAHYLPTFLKNFHHHYLGQQGVLHIWAEMHKMMDFAVMKS